MDSARRDRRLLGFGFGAGRGLCALRGTVQGFNAQSLGLWGLCHLHGRSRAMHILGFGGFGYKDLTLRVGLYFKVCCRNVRRASSYHMEDVSKSPGKSYSPRSLSSASKALVLNNQPQPRRRWMLPPANQPLSPQPSLYIHIFPTNLNPK